MSEPSSKVQNKTPTSSFWDNAEATVLKAHEAILVDDLSPLGVKPSQELMSSHVHKVMQYLDYEEKYVVAKSNVESLSTENESLKGQIFALVDEAKKDKDCLKTLEKSIDIEKVFSKLKDKQIDEALQNAEKAGLKAVEKFKFFDEYSDKIYDYYMEVCAFFFLNWARLFYALVDEAKKDKDCLKTLEKSIDIEKVFSKLKDKQIDEALQNAEKAGLKAVEKFKFFDEYSDKIYDYYMEGFELF
nr:hypothetical protein CFP56_63859 [Quercus suber]